MKRNINKPIFIISGSLGLLIIILLFNTWQTRSQTPPWLDPTYSTIPATPTRPAWCKPLPNQTIIEVTASPTPDRFKQMVPIIRTEQPPPTPYPIAHTIDLAPDLPPEDKVTVWVFRCNGEKDKYLFGDITDSDLLKAIKLGEGDVIINSAPPASLMGKHIPPLVPTITQTVIIQTPITYPIGQEPQRSAPTPIITQTQNPYP